MVARACLQASNEDTKEHLYETLMAECRDTIQAVREELKSEAVRPPVPRPRPPPSDHQSNPAPELRLLCPEAARAQL